MLKESRQLFDNAVATVTRGPCITFTFYLNNRRLETPTRLPSSKMPDLDTITEFILDKVTEFGLTLDENKEPGIDTRGNALRYNLYVRDPKGNPARLVVDQR